MSTQPAPPSWWPLPGGIGALFAIVVLILAFLMLLHVVPVEALTIAVCFLLLAIARLVP